MRIAFWFILFVGVALLFVGLATAAPLHPDIPTDVLKDWYRSHAVLAAVVAGILGLVAGLGLAPRTRHIPHEDSVKFHTRVALRGLLLGYLMPFIIVSSLLLLFAARTEELPLSQGDRIQLLFGSGKIVLVFGAIVIASGLAFAIMTRSRVWGGQYSMLSRKLIPRVK